MPYSHETRMIGCTTENLYIKKGKIEFQDVSFGYANRPPVTVTIFFWKLVPFLLL